MRALGRRLPACWPSQHLPKQGLLQMAEDTQQNSPAPAQTNSPANSGPSDNSGSARSSVSEAKSRMYGGAASLQSDQPKAVAPPEREPGSGSDDPTSSEHANPATPEANNNKLQPDGIAQRQNRNPKDVRSISKLTAQKYQLRAEVDRLKMEVEELRKLQGNAPKQEDYEDPQEFQQAKIEHNLEVKQASRTIDAQSRALQQRQSEEWTGRCQELTKDFAKFSHNYSQNIDWLKQNEPELLEISAHSTIGPRILEEAFDDLFANKATFENWQARSPQGKRELLARIEANLMREYGQPPQDQQKPNSSPAPAKSAAPAPITPDGKGAGGAAGEPATIRAKIESAKRRMFS